MKSNFLYNCILIRILLTIQLFTLQLFTNNIIINKIINLIELEVIHSYNIRMIRVLIVN